MGAALAVRAFHQPLRGCGAAGGNAAASPGLKAESLALTPFGGGFELVPLSRELEVSEGLTSLAPAFVPANVSLIMRS
jgi:hypothetical protein